MLDVSATADAARRLMDALEASRVSPGTGAVSDSRGEVPRELAEAFRALLEQTQEPAQTAQTPGATAARATEAPQGASVVDQTPPTRQSDLAADAVPSTGSGNAATPTEGQLLSPLEFYRLQFATNMQVFEGKFFSTFRDQAQSQLEETLKSTN